MKRHAPHLLIVEDDYDTAELMAETLSDHYGVECATIVDRVADALSRDLDEIDLVLSDYNLPDGTGMELVEALLAKRGDLPIVMVTSEAGLDLAMKAIHMGAYDYVVKAGEYMFTVPLIVQKNLAVWETKQDNSRLQEQLKHTLDEVRIKNQQLEEMVVRLEEQAATDPLTGLANRRSINEQLDRAFAESQRYGSDLVCAMIDLDGFKSVNDALGHQAGDKLLETAARVLLANCRRSDVAGRYGGDEFVLLMPQTDPDTAKQALLRVQDQFKLAIRPLVGTHRFGMSIGLACMSLNRPAAGEQLVAMADAALYKVKAEGKGGVYLHEPAPLPNRRVESPRS